MNKTNHIAIDMGSSSTRMLLFESNGNELTFKECIYRFENKKNIENNSIFWDVKDILRNIEKGLSKIKVNIDTIGIDGWGVDFAYIDKDLNLLDKVYCYRDESAQKVFDEQKIDYFKQTGVSNSPINTSTQIARDNVLRKEIVKDAKYILNISDLFNFFLTGKIINEYSIIKTSQLISADEKVKNTDISKQLDIDHIDINPIVAGKVIGSLKKEFTNNKFLANTQVILVGGHDTASALVPLNLSQGDMFVALGSWIVAGTISDKAIINSKTVELELSNEGDVKGGIKLLKNINGLYLLQRAKQELGMNFPEIISLAQEGANTNSFDTNDSILLNESITLFERIDEYCLKHNIDKPQDTNNYLKMIYNSLIASVKKTILDIQTLTKTNAKKIVFFGGGVQDKFLIDLFKKELSNIAPVEIGPIESTAFGNAMMQCATLNNMNANELKFKEGE